jgi:hypothetical protein
MTMPSTGPVAAESGREAARREADMRKKRSDFMDRIQGLG